jgi:homocysteine S-methyltransferase
MLDAIEKMAAVADRPLSAQPNAGVPQNIDGRNMYLVSPEYLAEYARRFVQAGARVVGGCCGTTPAHIRAIRSALKTIRSDAAVYAPGRTAEFGQPQPPSPAVRERSKLGEKIASGSFVSIVECVPPLGCNASTAIASARMLADTGIDAINIPDSPRSSSRMSPLALAVLIRNAVGIDVLLHYCCRDRNILGMQSDLLGAHALGLRNLLIITGDPIRTVDYPDATAVFDVDSIGLTNIVSRLNQGRDIGERTLAEPTSFLIGVGVNPGSVHFEEEIRRFEWKVKAGADFAITQPVFDIDILQRFLDRIAPLGIPIVAGIWPLASYRNAEFINNELPGVAVPDPILRRMKDAPSGELALREGVAIAAEILREIAPRVRGVQISAPFARYECAVDVIARGLGRTNP